MSLLCKVFGHLFKKHPDSVETKSCDKWDNCNRKDHQFDLFYWTCRRCGYCKIERFEDGVLVRKDN